MTLRQQLGSTLVRSRLRFVETDLFRWFARLFLIAWIVVECVPLVYVVGISLTSSRELGNTFLYLFPRKPTAQNYFNVVPFFDSNSVGLWRLLVNNGIYTVVPLLGSLAIVTPAAFAFATMRFHGRRWLFYVILLQLVVPFEIIVVPVFITVRTLGFSGSYWAVILPAVANIALPLVILTAFFKGLPSELFDAARVDGCNSFQLFRHIALPISWPALATVIIFEFIAGWNIYALPLVMVNNSDLMNLPVALAGFINGRAETAPWELLATAIVISTIPATIVFLAFQRRLVEGLREGISKG